MDLALFKINVICYYSVSTKETLMLQEKEEERNHTENDTKTGDEVTSPLRGNHSEEADMKKKKKEKKKKKKKEKKSAMAIIFDPFLVLYTGWRTYARQKVVFAGLALATLYMTVLGFDSITIGMSCELKLLRHDLRLPVGSLSRFKLSLPQCTQRSTLALVR